MLCNRSAERLNLKAKPLERLSIRTPHLEDRIPGCNLIEIQLKSVCHLAIPRLTLHYRVNSPVNFGVNSVVNDIKNLG